MGSVGADFIIARWSSLIISVGEGKILKFVATVKRVFRRLFFACLTFCGVQRILQQIFARLFKWSRLMPGVKVTNINERRRIPMRAIRDVVKQIAEKFNPDKIILFGSYANGKPRPESDVDLLVIMDSPLRNRQQAAEIARSLDYHFGLDLLVRSPQQLAVRIELGDFFLREVMETGKVLYARPHARMG